MFRLLHKAGVRYNHKNTKDIIIFCTKGKAIPLQVWTGSGWGWVSQMSRQSAHDGSKVINLKHRPSLTPRKYSWHSFLLEAESTPGPYRIMFVKNSNGTIGNRTRDLTACSVVIFCTRPLLIESDWVSVLTAILFFFYIGVAGGLAVCSCTATGCLTLIMWLSL